MFLNLTEVGNPWVIGMVENDQELRVDEMLENISGPLSIDEFEDSMLKYGINYGILPQYLKDRLDEINVY